MRIFISTGEVSGDLQGAMLVEALKRQAEAKSLDLEISALGGDRMAAAGAHLLGNTAAIGSIGIVEAIPFLLPTWQMQRRVKRYLKENPPDILVLLDYMGPNVSLGTYFRRQFPQIPIAYYIAPQTWVWSPSNRAIQQLVNIIDELLAIFPAEAQFFADKGVPVKWVGHPLLDRMKQAPTRDEARQALGVGQEEMAVALFPASRHQELKYHLPLMVQVARQLQERLPQVRFLIPTSLPAYRSAIEAAMREGGIGATVFNGREMEVMAAADLALTKSGTVNLELALLGIPQVVLFRVNPLTIWLARHILKFSIPFMSPVNLVVMREIVPEFLQEEAKVAPIVEESLALLLDFLRREQLRADLQEMRTLLGEVGACDRAAAEILELADRKRG